VKISQAKVVGSLFLDLWTLDSIRIKELKKLNKFRGHGQNARDLRSEVRIVEKDPCCELRVADYG